MKPAETALRALDFFQGAGGPTGGNLLDEKIAFVALPAAADGERALRLHKRLALEARLIQEFGLMARREALEDRKADPNA